MHSPTAPTQAGWQQKNYGDLSCAAPDPVGDFDDARELGALLRFAERIALDRAGEAALRAEGEPRERRHFRRLVDAAPQLIGRLHARALARHQPEGDALSLGQIAQWLEAAGARRVVLEEVAGDVDAVQEHLGHRIVAALRRP